MISPRPSTPPAARATSPEALKVYVTALKARRAQIEEDRQAHRQKLRSRLPAVVRHLVEHHGAKRVILFGSLARETATERSDVDLLVEGVGTLALLDAAGPVSRILGVEPDLVAGENVRPEIRKRIEVEGEVLHG